MLFNSFIFLGLLLITFVLYYLPFLKKNQITVFIVSSLIFYGYHQPELLLLLLLSAAINIVSSYYVVYGDVVHRKAWTTAGVSLNLLILLFFKYSPLISETFLPASDPVGAFLMTIPLPIGISFFTFQGISLMVDVYTEKYVRGSDVLPKSFLKHAERVLFFKSFFPQLISGPIIKAHDFLPQIRVKLLSAINWEFVFKNLITGYFLKMVVADNLKDFTFWIAFPYFQKFSSLTLLSMLFGFSIQIFSDFAGYSLIAIGLAALFGYEFRPNFDFPYLATSLKQFWTKWHISLSGFLREYLYIPLGGNKNGRIRTYLNLLIVMLLGGLWHGASWNYLFWGAFHGLALIVERIFSYKKAKNAQERFQILRGVLVFIVVTIGWLFFKLINLNHVGMFVKSVASNTYFKNDLGIMSYISIYCLPVVLYHFLNLLPVSKKHELTTKYGFVFYGIMIFLILFNSGRPGAFIYFQF